jgi:hypothetical protein
VPPGPGASRPSRPPPGEVCGGMIHRFGKSRRTEKVEVGRMKVIAVPLTPRERRLMNTRREAYVMLKINELFSHCGFGN